MKGITRGSSGARQVAAWALMLFASTASAQEAGVLVRQSDLLQAPFSDAERSATLAEQTEVTVLARQGAWMQVRAGEQSGWVRLLSVRIDAGARAQAASGVGKAVNVALTGSSGTAVATGVRGLDQEQIANASPNLAAVDGLEAYAVGDSAARAWAAEAPTLAAQDIKPLKR